MTPEQNIKHLKASLSLAGLVLDEETIEIIIALYEKVRNKGNELYLSEVILTVAAIRNKHKNKE